MENYESEEKDFFIIGEDEADTRIDKVLPNRYDDGRSRNYFQFLIQNGYVTVNGSPVKKQYRPSLGDEVEVQFVVTPEMDLAPEDIPLDIIYEDEHLLAVNKPAGMVVHPAPGNWSGTFVNALLFHCRLQKDDFGKGSCRPGIVHRLDKDTSGVLIAAKDVVTHQRLTDLFSSRNVTKQYVAICCGSPGSGEVNAPIGRHPVNRKMMCVREDGGREAITRFETLAGDGKRSVVRIQLITGRTHQIRVHMKHRGTPVLGDDTYGNVQLNKRYHAERQLLHARQLELEHPATGNPLRLVAPFPDDIKAVFGALHYEEGQGEDTDSKG